MEIELWKGQQTDSLYLSTINNTKEGKMKLTLPPLFPDFKNKNEIRAWYWPKIKKARERLMGIIEEIMSVQEPRRSVLERERELWELEKRNLESGLQGDLKRFEGEECSVERMVEKAMEEMRGEYEDLDLGEGKEIDEFEMDGWEKI